MFTYLWNDIYEKLDVKPVGPNLFSLLGSSSSSSVDASSSKVSNLINEAAESCEMSVNVYQT